MKKLLVLLIVVLFLTGCKAKKEDYYNLIFEDTTIVVGYDLTDVINDSLHINSYDYHLNKKEEEILDYLEIYVKDLDNPTIYIDDYKVNGIKNTCSDLNGEIVSNNGNSCVLHKTIKDTENIIILHGDILNDDSNVVDRIEVSYK